MKIETGALPNQDVIQASTNEGQKRSGTQYDVFISYSHAQDLLLAKALKEELQGFTRRWNRLGNALKVFLDQTSLAAGPRLANVLLEALSRSDWFILIASPQSAAAEWVNWELDQWIRLHNGTDRILIACTDGAIHWAGRRGRQPTAGSEEKADFDWELTTALNRKALEGKFDSEPVWIDLRPLRQGASAVELPRFGDLIAEFVAPIRNSSKDSLVGNQVRYERRTKRILKIVGTVLVALLFGISVAAYVVTIERNQAITQARIATARGLAAESESLLDTHLDVAQLLAVQAYRLNDDEQSRAALLRSVTASPSLVRYLQVGQQVTAVAGSENAGYAITGTVDGDLDIWDLSNAAKSDIGSLSAPVSGVGISSDGTVGAGTGGASLVVWTTQKGPHIFALPSAGQAVAVSPSGKYVAVASQGIDPQSGDTTSPSQLTLVDSQSGEQRSTPLDNSPFSVNFDGDDELVLTSYSGWERRAVPAITNSPLSNGGVGMGVHVRAVATSVNGKYFGYDHGSGIVPILSTEGNSSSGRSLEATSPGGAVTALAISPGGDRLAVADAGKIFISSAGSLASQSSPGNSLLPGEQSVLTGNSDISHLAFMGENTRLLSSSRNAIAIWDIDQLTRLSTAQAMSIDWSCEACLAPTAALSRDGRFLAAVDGAVRFTTVHDMTSGRDIDTTKSLPTNETFLGWTTRNGTEVLAFASPGNAVEFRIPEPGLPVSDRWASGASDYPPIGLDSGGVKVVGANSEGGLRVWDGLTGTTIASIPNAGLEGSVHYQQMDSTGSYVVQVVDVDDTNREARLSDLADGVTRIVGSGNVAHASFSGQWLIIKRTNGPIEIWDRTGTNLEGGFGQDSSYLGGQTTVQAKAAVVGDLLVQQRSDGSFAVTDRSSGNLIASLGFATTTVGFTRTGILPAPSGDALFAVTEAYPGPSNLGAVVRWSMSIDDWVQVACETSGRELLPAEWSQYGLGADLPYLPCRG